MFIQKKLGRSCIYRKYGDNAQDNKRFSSFGEDYREFFRLLLHFNNAPVRRRFMCHMLTLSILCSIDGQAKVILGDDDEKDRTETFFRFEVDIMPNGGPYQGGSFRFEFCVEKECQWPREPPIIRCLTDIYHPNIDHLDRDDCSNVCVSVLDRDVWSADQCDFETCVQALLFLFYQPNFDDALSPVCCSDEDFQELVQISLKGGTIDGFQFRPNKGRINNILEEIT